MDRKMNSISFVKKHFPDVRILQLLPTLGLPGEQMLESMRQEENIILTLNNDTCVFPDFIEKFIQPIMRDLWLECVLQK